MKQLSHYNQPEYQGFETDARIIQAIDALTGCSILTPDNQTENDENPAYLLWATGSLADPNGGPDTYGVPVVKDWLNRYHPDWITDAPLSWGEEQLADEE